MTSNTQLKPSTLKILNRIDEMAKVAEGVRDGRVDALTGLQEISGDNFVQDYSDRNLGHLIWWERWNNLHETITIAA